LCERKTSASPRSHAWLRVRVRVRVSASVAWRAMPLAGHAGLG